MINSNHRLTDSSSRPFGDIYKGKRILITGHTGFKGSWLAIWLKLLGAEIIGYSSFLPSMPCNFEVCNLQNHIIHIEGDVRDIHTLKEVVSRYEPDIIFHLAAQAITRRSYNIPQDTFFTNLGGTVNILECIRISNKIKAAVIITSDKCYQNLEWIWGYRENDRLGGDDPYSASKACAEIATRAYIKSFFSRDGAVNVATARAGNVIGGGDWAEDRIVPDCVRALSKEERLEIRSPKATRPWQHVLEPMGGYLWLGAHLLNNNKDCRGESFNFGPLSDVNRTVEELIIEFAKTWQGMDWYVPDNDKSEKKESMLLKLNCDKALHLLDWHATLSFDKTVKMSAEWYKSFYHHKGLDMFNYTVNQIEEYTMLAKKQGLKWAI